MSGCAAPSMEEKCPIPKLESYYVVDGCQCDCVVSWGPHMMSPSPSPVLPPLEPKKKIDLIQKLEASRSPCTPAFRAFCREATMHSWWYLLSSASCSISFCFGPAQAVWLGTSFRMDGGSAMAQRWLYLAGHVRLDGQRQAAAEPRMGHGEEHDGRLPCRVAIQHGPAELHRAQARGHQPLQAGLTPRMLPALQCPPLIPMSILQILQGLQSSLGDRLCLKKCFWHFVLHKPLHHSPELMRGNQN